MAKKGSVTSRIARYIRDNIQSGEWTVGQKIPSENQFCQILGVSRISVRSALQQFIALGVMESVHGKGTYLLSNDLSMFLPASDSEVPGEERVQEMKHLLEFRALIEPAMCERVAQNPSQKLIDRLSELVGKMQASVGQSETFVEADTAFHVEICNASGNPVVSGVMTDILQRRMALGRTLNLAVGYYGGIYYHNIILDSIRRHDGKRARSMMQEHLERGIEDLGLDYEEPPGGPSRRQQ